MNTHFNDVASNHKLKQGGKVALIIEPETITCALVGETNTWNPPEGTSRPVQALVTAVHMR